MKRQYLLILIVLFRFDLQTNQWSNEIAPTSSCRTSVGVAVLDGCLFAVGGQDGLSCLNLVEK
jgi:kelch-like protein 20